MVFLRDSNPNLLQIIGLHKFSVYLVNIIYHSYYHSYFLLYSGVISIVFGGYCVAISVLCSLDKGRFFIIFA